jgi:ATP-dependent DNA helicase RecG
MIIKAEEQSGVPLPLDSLIALAHLRHERRLDVNELARVIQKSESAARAVLERLTESGLVEAHGVKKGRTYMLSAAVYGKMGKPSGYVRQVGFDAIQQEEMILKYVRTSKKITRKDAVFLCQISERQASHVLLKLSKIGKLNMVGKGRGAHYVGS